MATTKKISKIAQTCSKPLDECFACETEHGANSSNCFDYFIKLKVCVEKTMCPLEYETLRKCVDSKNNLITSCAKPQKDLDLCATNRLKASWEGDE